MTGSDPPPTPQKPDGMLHPPNGGPAHRGCHVSDLIEVPGRLHANVAIGALQIRSNSVMNNASSGPPNSSVLSKQWDFKKYA